MVSPVWLYPPNGLAATLHACHAQWRIQDWGQGGDRVQILVEWRLELCLNCAIPPPPPPPPRAREAFDGRKCSAFLVVMRPLGVRGEAAHWVVWEDMTPGSASTLSVVFFVFLVDWLKAMCDNFCRLFTFRFCSTAVSVLLLACSIRLFPLVWRLSCSCLMHHPRWVQYTDRKVVMTYAVSHCSGLVCTGILHARVPLLSLWTL